jgi:GNAT superfamily N-acetyltransferase
MTLTIGDEVVVPHRPDVPGLRFRRFRGPADYPGMVAANQATRDEAGVQEVITVEAMANTYDHLVNSDPDRDILIVERGGRVIGYARVEWRDLTDGTRAFTTICLLDPAERRQGIGRAMLEWSEGRLRDTHDSLPDSATVSSQMQAFTFGQEVGAVRLLEQAGWTREGYGFEMVRPSLTDIPDVPLPPGLAVRAIGTDEASRRRVWEAMADGFRDSRAEPEWTEEDWGRFFADPVEDPALWLIAFDGDEIAGGVLGKIDPAENAHHGRERGIVSSVFTRPAWRRRGLARALIARALTRLRDHGMTSAYLGVDGLNPNQAMTLYGSLGFEVESEAIDWTKPFPSAGDEPTTETTP